MIVHLLDDSYADSNSITFVRPTYHFFLQTAQGGQIDITDLITRVDKKALVPDFDESRENLRISAQGGLNHPNPGEDHGPSKGKTYDERGLWSIFSENVADDIRTIPKTASSVLIPLAVITVAAVLLLRK